MTLDHRGHPLLGLWQGSSDHHLFDAGDQAQHHDLAGSARERDYVQLLRHALQEVEAPEEHLERLGLAP